MNLLVRARLVTTDADTRRTGPRSAGPGLAPAAVMARRGRRGPEDPAPPGRRRRRVGVASAANRASCTAAPASNRPSNGRRRRPRTSRRSSGTSSTPRWPPPAPNGPPSPARTGASAGCSSASPCFSSPPSSPAAWPCGSASGPTTTGRWRPAQERAPGLRAVVSDSLALRTTNRDVAALLAIEAHRLAPSGRYRERPVLHVHRGAGPRAHRALQRPRRRHRPLPPRRQDGGPRRRPGRDPPRRHGASGGNGDAARRSATPTDATGCRRRPMGGGWRWRGGRPASTRTGSSSPSTTSGPARPDSASTGSRSSRGRSP